MYEGSRLTSHIIAHPCAETASPRDENPVEDLPVDAAGRHHDDCMAGG